MYIENLNFFDEIKSSSRINTSGKNVGTFLSRKKNNTVL